jgi:predicted negative regulator of RcsB-dependent stress response
LIADLKSLLGQSEKADMETRVIERTPQDPWRNNLGWLTRNGSKAAFGAVVIAGILAVWQMWPNLNSHFFFAPQSREAERPDSAVVPRLTHLAVDAERRSIKAAETLKLNLKGQYSDGSQREVTDAVQWLSSDMRVATVDAHGEVKALQPGTTNISAKVGQVESAQWTLGVESLGLAAKPIPAPKLVALNITSSKYEFTESERVALRARGKFSDNSEKTLSTGVEWEISDRTIASVNERGELVARRPGKIKVVARSDELASSPLTLLIKETRKTSEPPAKPTHPAELQPAKSSAPSEQTKARIAAHMDRAQLFREQGNYAGALAELERAKAIDAANEEIKREIEQTKRACNAERVLGNKPNC